MLLRFVSFLLASSAAALVTLLAAAVVVVSQSTLLLLSWSAALARVAVINAAAIGVPPTVSCE